MHCIQHGDRRCTERGEAGTGYDVNNHGRVARTVPSQQRAISGCDEITLPQKWQNLRQFSSAQPRNSAPVHIEASYCAQLGLASTHGSSVVGSPDRIIRPRQQPSRGCIKRKRRRRTDISIQSVQGEGSEMILRRETGRYRSIFRSAVGSCHPPRWNKRDCCTCLTRTGRS